MDTFEAGRLARQARQAALRGLLDDLETSLAEVEHDSAPASPASPSFEATTSFGSTFRTWGSDSRRNPLLGSTLFAYSTEVPPVRMALPAATAERDSESEEGLSHRSAGTTATVAFSETQDHFGATLVADQFRRMLRPEVLLEEAGFALDALATLRAGPSGLSVPSRDMDMPSPASQDGPDGRDHGQNAGDAEDAAMAFDSTVRTIFTDTMTSDSEVSEGMESVEAALEGVLRRLPGVSPEGLEEALRRSVERMMDRRLALSEEGIQALPKVQFGHPDAPREESQCSICLADYKDGELLNGLRCGHFFHAECIARWLKSSDQCPLCRCSQADG